MQPIRRHPLLVGRATRRSVLVSVLWTSLTLVPLAFGDLRIDPEVIDLGWISDQDVVDVPVLVWNDGDEAVRVADLGATCDACLTYRFEQDWIAPGEFSVLDLQFRPEGLNDAVEEFVALRIEGSQQTAAHVVVRADVMPAYYVIGGPVVFERMTRDETREWRVRLVPQLQRPDDLAVVESTHPGFSGTVIHEPDRGTYLLTIRAGPFAEAGIQSTFFHISSESSGIPECVIPALAYRVPEKHIYPAGLRFTNQDDEQLRIIFVDHDAAGAPGLSRVEIPSPQLACKVFSDSALPKTRVNVYAFGLQAFTGYLGDVVLHFADETQPPVRVPVNVYGLQGVALESACRQQYEQYRQMLEIGP